MRMLLVFYAVFIFFTFCCWFVFTGIGLTVHALFLVITAVLWVVHYPILPFVFDNLPLYMNDEIHYLRSEVYLSYISDNNNV